MMSKTKMLLVAATAGVLVGVIEGKRRAKEIEKERVEMNNIKYQEEYKEKEEKRRAENERLWKEWKEMF